MSYRVFLTAHALRDLEEIDDYIVAADSPQNADRVLDQIERRFKSLGEFPERGTFPRELLKLGIRDFREVHYKPYRIIYRIQGRNVYILLIADGRRDMQSLLGRRLLRA